MFLFILITCLLDVVLIWLAEILSWSLMGVNPFNSQDLIGDSPYCLPNDFHYVSLENLVLNQ